MNLKYFLLFLIIASCFLGGCANDDAVYLNSKAKSEYNKLFYKNNEDLKKITYEERIHYYTLEILKKEKPIAAVVALTSIALAMLVYRSVEKEKRIRKTAVGVFGIGIPVFCGVITMILVVIARLTLA